jgi:hypothetical protein
MGANSAEDIGLEAWDEVVLARAGRLDEQDLKAALRGVLDRAAPSRASTASAHKVAAEKVDVA